MPDLNEAMRMATELQAQSSSGQRFDVAAHCFDAQRPFATSRAKYETGSCSRRAGKTEGAAAKMCARVLETPGSVGLYITKTRVNAKRIFWGTLKRGNRERTLGGEAKEAE